MRGSLHPHLPPFDPAHVHRVFYRGYVRHGPICSVFFAGVQNSPDVLRFLKPERPSCGLGRAVSEAARSRQR